MNFTRYSLVFCRNTLVTLLCWTLCSADHLPADFQRIGHRKFYSLSHQLLISYSVESALFRLALWKGIGARYRGIPPTASFRPTRKPPNKCILPAAAVKPSQETSIGKCFKFTISQVYKGTKSYQFWHSRVFSKRDDVWVTRTSYFLF